MDDVTQIAGLVTRWTFFRDQEDWDALRDTFVPEGRISISWFDGSHERFVAASQQMAARGGSRLKHQLGPPAVRVRGDRALCEVNVIIRVRAATPYGEIDTSSYARFLDRLVRHHGKWKFAERVGVYEQDRIDPVDSPSLPAELYQGLDAFPAPIRFLARSLTRAGLSVSASAVMDGSPEWKALQAGNQAWLLGG